MITSPKKTLLISVVIALITIPVIWLILYSSPDFPIVGFTWSIAALITLLIIANLIQVYSPILDIIIFIIILGVIHTSLILAILTIIRRLSAKK